MGVRSVSSSTALSLQSSSIKSSDVSASAQSLLNEAVYYIDAQTGINYIPTTASGYMYLPGVANNYASRPDSAAIDITGDIDLRVKVALDNWTPSSAQMLIAKFGTSGNWSYAFWVTSESALTIQWSNNGTTTFSATSTELTQVANGATKWVRVTLDVNNGASGRDVKFYLSDDGTTWTQLGTTITTAGTTSIYAGTAVLEIGTSQTGTANAARGKFYRAQVLNGIDGTVAFDANFETAMTSQTVTSFTESSSNAATVTINRTTYNFQLDTINNLGTAGSLLPTTLGSSIAADSNDPKFLDFTGTNYVYLPGATGNNMTVPDSAALDITGDIDIRVYAALDSWFTAAETKTLISKDGATTGTRSWSFDITPTTNLFQFYWTTDGTTRIIKQSTVSPSVTSGQPKWARVTLDVDNGSSGNDVKFYVSDDGITWTQVGSTVNTVGTTSIAATTTEIQIGSVANLQLPASKFYRAQVFNGIDGTKVLDVDTSVITAGNATSFTAVTGQTVTINRGTSGRKAVAVTQPCWLFGTDDYMEVNNRYLTHSGTNYLYLPGVVGNNATTPDSVAISITGDIDVRVKVAMDDWTPGSYSVLAAHWNPQSNTKNWLFALRTDGKLEFFWSTNGANGFGAVSTVATGVTDGANKWLKVTQDVDNGASGNDVAFYLSDDGITWTQLGTTITSAGTVTRYDTFRAVSIGSTSEGTNSSPSRGKFFRAQVLNGIDGTVAFDANFETGVTSLNQTTFTESSANAATVTINRSGTGYRSAGITTTGYLYPGNIFLTSSTDFLNFGASQSFTVITSMRKFNNMGLSRVINKATNSSPFDGWYIRNIDNTVIQTGLLSPVSGVVEVLSSSFTPGNVIVTSSVINRNTQRLIAQVNSLTGNNGSTSAVNTISNDFPMRIGNSSAGGSQYMDMEFMGAAIWRRALLAPEIATIVNYFQSRGA